MICNQIRGKQIIEADGSSVFTSDFSPDGFSSLMLTHHLALQTLSHLNLWSTTKRLYVLWFFKVSLFARCCQCSCSSWHLSVYDLFKDLHYNRNLPLCLWPTLQLTVSALPFSTTISISTSTSFDICVSTVASTTSAVSVSAILNLLAAYSTWADINAHKFVVCRAMTVYLPDKGRGETCHILFLRSNMARGQLYEDHIKRQKDNLYLAPFRLWV